MEKFHMSKQSSIQKEFTVWCSMAGGLPSGHEGYRQSQRHNELEFIDHIESLGWLYNYKWNSWRCPACTKAVNNG